MPVRPRSVFWLALACIVGVALSRPQAAEPDTSGWERHVVLGMPAEAKNGESSKNAYLLTKKNFVISYNNSKGTPNWVAWNLRKSDLGNAKRPRPAPFHPDDTLPGTFLKIKPSDFKFGTTGFERGHMCPNADRTHSADNEKSTFVMTNMVPQSPALNEKAWGKLEEYCRQLVREDDQELFIYAGPEGKGGRSAKGFFNTTNGKVVVPAKCWKVIVCLPAEAGDPIMRVKETTRVIAVIMPNDQSLTNSWGQWRVSVKDVEELTGFKFFGEVPDCIRKELREQVDSEPIPGD